LCGTKAGALAATSPDSIYAADIRLPTEAPRPGQNCNEVLALIGAQEPEPDEALYCRYRHFDKKTHRAVVQRLSRGGYAVIGGTGVLALWKRARCSEPACVFRAGCSTSRDVVRGLLARRRMELYSAGAAAEALHGSAAAWGE
jgi:hypothetical protein